MNESILANRQITINEISNELGVSQGNEHKIADQLIFHKVCSRWVPHINRGIYKKSILNVCLNFCNVSRRKEITFWTKL